MDEKREIALRQLTVDQLLKHQESILSNQIELLNKTIRLGYHHKHEAEEILTSEIGKTLTNMDNIREFALPILCLKSY